MSSEVKLIEDWRERWEERTKDGYLILAVASRGVGMLEAWANTSVGMRTFGDNNLIPKPRPKKLRPWRREEVPVGSVVRHRLENTIHTILCYEKNDSIWVAGAGNIFTTVLLSRFVLHDLNPDGTWKPVEECRPCGVETGSLELQQTGGAGK